MKIFFFLFICTRILSQEFNYLPNTSNNEIIKHSAYSLSYIEQYEQAEFVAYKLSRNMLGGNEERTDKFVPDTLVTTGSALSSDYNRTGYDRGHLCPAADMSFSPLTMKESFYMSNMSPQRPGFNRGIWKQLEAQVRTWAIKDSLIYVVTGPVFKNKMKYIGKKNKVAVPGQYYKIILEYKKDSSKAIAFLLPNRASNKPLSKYVVPIDSVEIVTGIDFFPELPDDIENKLEQKSELANWKFN